MDQQQTTWPEVSAVGDRWYELKQRLDTTRASLAELEIQEQQARAEVQRAFAHLGIAVPTCMNDGAAPQAVDDGLVPCTNDCGQRIKPRGQKVHNRRCPAYIAPEATTHALPRGSMMTLTPPASSASVEVSSDLAASPSAEQEPETEAEEPITPAALEAPAGDTVNPQ